MLRNVSRVLALMVTVILAVVYSNDTRGGEGGVYAATITEDIRHEGWHDCAGCDGGTACILGCPISNPMDCGNCYQWGEGSGYDCFNYQGGCAPEDEEVAADGTVAVAINQDMSLTRQERTEHNYTIVRKLCNGVLLERNYGEADIRRIDTRLHTIAL